jgi:hypothetical protein
VPIKAFGRKRLPPFETGAWQAGNCKNFTDRIDMFEKHQK